MSKTFWMAASMLLAGGLGVSFAGCDRESTGSLFESSTPESGTFSFTSTEVSTTGSEGEATSSSGEESTTWSGSEGTTTSSSGEESTTWSSTDGEPSHELTAIARHPLFAGELLPRENLVLLAVDNAALTCADPQLSDVCGANSEWRVSFLIGQRKLLPGATFASGEVRALYETSGTDASGECALSAGTLDVGQIRIDAVTAEWVSFTVSGINRPGSDIAPDGSYTAPRCAL